LAVVTKTDVHKIDALDQWCLRKLLGIKWHHHVRNDDVRQKTEQPHLPATVQARQLSLFSHIWRIRCQADLNSFPLGELQETIGTPPYYVDLKLMNLSLNEATDVAQNRPLWRLMSTFGATHS